MFGSAALIRTEKILGCLPPEFETVSVRMFEGRDGLHNNLVPDYSPARANRHSTDGPSVIGGNDDSDTLANAPTKGHRHRSSSRRIPPSSPAQYRGDRIRGRARFTKFLRDRVRHRYAAPAGAYQGFWRREL
jgi:hypothetical protein